MIGDIIGAGISTIGRLIGGAQDRAAADEINQRNIALQREFAQSGIQWKVEDAKKAGIHPLYAIGAGTTSFSPVTAGAASPLGDIGQDIGRAVTSTMNSEEKVGAISTKMAEAQLENQLLQNQKLASDIAKQNQVGSAPPMPVGQRWLVDGQGNIPSASTPNLVADKALERVAADPGRPFSEPGALTDVGYVRTAGGGYAPVPSKDAKERIEDNVIQEVMWAIRNNLLPSLGVNEAPPRVPGHWYYNPLYQEYRQHDPTDRRFLSAAGRAKLDRYLDYVRGRDSFNSRFTGRR